MLFTAKYKLFLHRETFKKGFLYIFRYHFDDLTRKSIVSMVILPSGGMTPEAVKT